MAVLEFPQHTNLTERIPKAIQDQERAVHGVRQRVDGLKSQVDKARQAWRREHASLLEELDSAKAELSIQTGLLRAMTEETYRQTGITSPAPGASVRRDVSVEFDEVEALQWAVRNGMFVQLDRRGFVAYACTNPDAVPFARVRIGPRAIIAADLSKALEG